MLDLQGILICVPLYTVAVLLLGASISAGLFVFHVAVVPLIFKYSKTFRRCLVFANFVQWPPYIDFEEPSASGIDGGRNITIEYQSKVDNCPIRIGLWHILPKTVYDRLKDKLEITTDKEELNKILDNELANSKTPIVMYCHGNSNSRAASHRILLYKFFQQMDFHTVALDYRVLVPRPHILVTKIVAVFSHRAKKEMEISYGDSTNIHPTENGVVEDSLMVYEWLYSTVDRTPSRPPIFIWGHSLGTGISSHLLGNLDELSKTVLERAAPLPLPNGLILEAPFNNLADEVAKHPLSKLVTWLPYYEATFVAPFRSAPEHEFRSDKHLSRTHELPILILHAKDDVIVPFIVGLKLYRSVLESRAKGGAMIKLHAFDKKENLGHKYICNAADLPEVVGDFVKNNL